MDREQVIGLLAQGEGYLSGEEMSRALSVTRAAVWKEITALREEGWPISSAPRQGYRLEGDPPRLSGAYISAKLPQDSLFSGKVTVLDSVDSTNTRLKAMAAQGAATGTVLLAEEQTGGRGTRGRLFLSPKGQGLYLSVLLRPEAGLGDLLTLTGWVAVAVRSGLQAACGAPVEIKWLNDIYLNGRKLVGVLTELSLTGESSEADYVVVGVGVNVSQTGETFQAQGLGEVATSLSAEGWHAERNRLAAAILNELDKLCRAFPQGREDYLAEYRRHCLTLGRAVAFADQGGTVTGVAQGVDEQFGLVIQGQDGRSCTVTSGTVTLL